MCVEVGGRHTLPEQGQSAVRVEWADTLFLRAEDQAEGEVRGEMSGGAKVQVGVRGGGRPAGTEGLLPG